MTSIQSLYSTAKQTISLTTITATSALICGEVLQSAEKINATVILSCFLGGFTGLFSGLFECIDKPCSSILFLATVCGSTTLGCITGALIGATATKIKSWHYTIHLD